MAKMTDKQIEAFYELGKQVYEKKISKKEAIDILANVHKMNKTSAEMYINFFLQMMKGEVHTYKISQAGLRYYLENVLHDFGVKQLKIFLESLELHIKYLQSENPSSALAFRVIHNEYSDKAGMPPKFN